MPEMKKVMSSDELKPGEMKQLAIEGKELLLANLEGEFYAIDDMCTHAEANLTDGELDGDSVECPLHGACFNIKTGRAESDPAEEDVRTYRVKVEDGQVFVEI